MKGRRSLLLAGVLVMVLGAIGLGWWQGKEAEREWRKFDEKRQLAEELFQESASAGEFRRVLGEPDEVVIEGSSEYWSYGLTIDGLVRRSVVIEVDRASRRVLDVSQLVMDAFYE